MQFASIISIPHTPRQIQKRMQLLLIIFIALALLYSTMIPTFEIMDEYHHYSVVQYIADHRTLPIQDSANTEAWHWEAAQPPLYYLLMAWLTAPLNRSDFYDYEANPYAKIGIGLATDNHVGYTHNWDAERFPWKGAALAVHLIRIANLVMSVLTIWLHYAIARLLFPQKPPLALVVTALTAFNPMFIAITASVSNDNLINLLFAFVIAIALTLWKDGFTWSRIWALAIAAALACLSKLSGLLTYFPIMLMIFAVVLRDHLPARYLYRSLFIFLAVFGALVGWWYLRNMALYGEPLAIHTMVITVGKRETPLNFWQLIQQEHGSFFFAYWGVFGLFNFLAPLNLFRYVLILWGIALIGFLLKLKKLSGHAFSSGSTTLFPLALLLLTLLLSAISLLRWSQMTLGSQGRLLFPVMVVINLYTILGLSAFFNARMMMILMFPLLFYAGFSGMIIITAIYEPTPIVDALPKEAVRTEFNYGPVQLSGYRAKDHLKFWDKTYHLPITLYWKSIDRTAFPWAFEIEMFYHSQSGEFISAGGLKSYPSGGLRNTVTWERNVIFRETYLIPLPQLPLPFPEHLYMQIHWIDENGRRIEFFSAPAQGSIIEIDLTDNVP